MPPHPFRFIFPSYLNDSMCMRLAARAGGPDEDALIDQAIRLLSPAEAFYLGVFPLQTPYGFAGEFLELPWHTTYTSSRPKQFPSIDGPITAEVAAVAVFITCIWDDPYQSAMADNLEYRPETQLVHGTQMTMVQALAVSCFLRLDYVLSAIFDRRIAEAGLHLALAHQRIIDCMLAAQEIWDAQQKLASNTATWVDEPRIFMLHE